MDQSAQPQLASQQLATLGEHLAGCATPAATIDQACTAALRSVLPSASRTHWAALKAAMAELPIGCLLLQLLAVYAGRLTASEPTSASEHTAWGRLLSAVSILALAEEHHRLESGSPPSAFAKAAAAGLLPVGVAARWLQNLWLLQSWPPPGGTAPYATLLSPALDLLGSGEDSAPLVAAVMVASVTAPGAGSSAALAGLSSLSASHHPRWPALAAGLERYAWWRVEEHNGTNRNGKTTTRRHRDEVRAAALLPTLAEHLEALSIRCGDEAGASAWAASASRGCLLPCTLAVVATLEEERRLRASGSTKGGKSPRALARCVAAIARLGSQAASTLSAFAGADSLSDHTSQEMENWPPSPPDGRRRANTVVSEGNKAAPPSDKDSSEGSHDFLADVWVAWLLVRAAMRTAAPAMRARRDPTCSLDNADAESFKLAVALRRCATASADGTRRTTRRNSSGPSTGAAQVALCASVRRAVEAVGLPVEPYLGLGAGLELLPVHLTGENAATGPPVEAVTSGSGSAAAYLQPQPEGAELAPKAGSAEQGAARGSVLLDKTSKRKKRRRKGRTAAARSVNPFICAVQSRGAADALSSSDSEGSGEEEDGYSDLEDFIVCNPDTDYGKLLSRRAKKAAAGALPH